MAERSGASIFEELNKNDKSYMADRYNTSKLLEVFVVQRLAEEMKNSPNRKPVILNCVNPGLCHSGLARNFEGFQAAFFTIFKMLLARRTPVGARTLVAGAEAGEESHGQYMSICKVVQPSPFVLSDEGKKTGDRVYKELMAILEKIEPGITKNI